MARAALDVPPVVDGSTVTFELSDRHGRLQSVRLVQEIGLAEPLDLVRTRGRWRLPLPVPPVGRMEYLFELEDHNGHRWTTLDPANPRRSAGAFGERSEARFPGYAEPEWLSSPPVEHWEQPLRSDGTVRGARLGGTLWQPTSLSPSQPAPLVVVHDGPEYAALGSFTRYLGCAIGSGALPPVRAALFAPGDRNAWYSASPAYARALSQALSSLDVWAPSTARVGVGVSLGGLAMLHAHRSNPGMLDALFLQSSSFFTADTDPQESAFRGFRAVTSFVLGVRAAAGEDHPVPTVLTCGMVEENLANNRAMATTLQHLGYPVRFVVVRDAHNYTAWRDSLHPHLTALVSDLARDRAA